MANEVWGIDIGKSALKAVKMRQAKNQVEIVGIEIVEYVQTSEEEVDKEEQTRQALAEFKNRTKIKKNERIFVSIPGQATFNRMITIPPVEAKRIKEIVTYEAQQQIPFPIDEVIWDYQLLSDTKALEEQEVMLFAVRKEIINNFLANLAAVEIAVEGIQIAPLALYNFARYDRPELENCVTIDIGAQNTDLVIIHGNKLWLRALPSAGDDITKALQKKFNIPYQEAEKLKIKAGKTKQAKRIFEVIKPVLKDIVGEIHRSVGYYKSMAKDIKFDKMLLLGNTTKLTGFPQFFSQNLQYDIEVVSNVNRIRISPQINVNMFQTNISGFAIALGLGVQGLGLAANNIRLLPGEIYERNILERQKKVLGVAVGILAIIPIWSLYNATTALDQVNGLTKKLASPKAEIAKFETRLKDVQSDGGIQKKLESLAQIGKGRYRWLEIINSLNSSFLEAQRTIQEERGNALWIYNLEIREIEEKIEAKPGQTASPDIKPKKYIEIKCEISFEAKLDRKGTRDYIEKHLKKVLAKYTDSKNRLLYYDIDISIDLSSTLFPTVDTDKDKDKDKDKEEKEKYCHATFILKSRLVEEP